MRWNCPHCRTQLVAAEDEISSSWSFALCAHCSRFGLVRKDSELVIKVDRAPPGEKFIRAGITGPLPVIRPASPRRRNTVAVAGRPIEQRKYLEARIPEPLPAGMGRNQLSPARLAFFACAALLAWNGYHRFTATSSGNATTDTIAAEEMAPQQIEVGNSVEPRSLNVLVRENPGRQAPVIGALDPNLRYTVLATRPETDGQWYRVDFGAKPSAWVSIQDVSPAN